jgi:hypothetical protein
MAKQKDRRRRDVTPPSPFEQARDELFQHIMRCGVIGSAAEHQAEWFGATMSYLSDRYPELSPAELADLRTLGDRFSQPAKRPEPEVVAEDAQSAA